jgi:hypothetical protein
MEKDLRRHVLSVHETGRKFVCALCQGIAFKRKDHFKRHLQNQHWMHSEEAYGASSILAVTAC